MRVTVIAIALLSAISSPAGAASFEQAFSPHQGATELVVKTIDGAKKEIHLAGYSFTSKPIGSALVAAHDRGVDVEVVLDKSQDDGKEMKWVRDHGVPVRINYKYAIMHDKFMVIDGTTVELGSFNYTAAAENKNAENVLVIHDAGKVAEAYAAQWEKLWGEGEAPGP
jgi:phosphatidylserine/phosphatidylglycerophosphate/cardiolipin synthase-like enzyme